MCALLTSLILLNNTSIVIGGKSADAKKYRVPSKKVDM